MAELRQHLDIKKEGFNACSWPITTNSLIIGQDSVLGKKTHCRITVRAKLPTALTMEALQQDGAEFRNELILLGTKEREAAT